MLRCRRPREARFTSYVYLTSRLIRSRLLSTPNCRSSHKLSLGPPPQIECIRPSTIGLTRIDSCFSVSRKPKTDAMFTRACQHCEKLAMALSYKMTDVPGRPYPPQLRDGHTQQAYSVDRSRGVASPSLLSRCHRCTSERRI